MCRIAGFIGNHVSDGDKRRVAAMCNALQHGGPDDEGIYVSDDNSVIFGHRRLSIIDLSANGHQPMADVSGKVIISFNGEVYNYPELKQQLTAMGAKFANHTDTEVILQAYLYWGVTAFGRLGGMFAFALHDTTTGEVYLVRDSAGIKPLYYHINNGQLTFASEIRAFKAAGITAANTNWPVYLLAYGHIPEPHTTLQNVFSLPKGTFLRWTKGGDNSINAYDVDTNIEPITDLSQAKQNIRELLTMAVKRQLIADAPIGVFLSGGVDSSLLTFLASKEIEQLKTVSIFFNEKQYDERMYQKLVLDQVNSENHTHLVQQQEFEQLLPEILKAMDMPTTDGINSWFISKYAREAGLKTVLSGIGGDELFGGYPSFNRVKYLSYLKALPKGLLSLLALTSSPGLKRLSYLTSDTINADYLALRGIFTSKDIAALTGMDVHEVETILLDTGSTYIGKNDKTKAAWLEINMYMQNQLLRDTDVMSMQHGLEVRVPFLDEEFAAMVSQIAPDVRFKSKSKQLLIDSFKGLLPDAIWRRPKMGFTFPLQSWMNDNTEISAPENYRGVAAKQQIKKFKEGRLHWSRVFALYQVQGHV